MRVPSPEEVFALMAHEPGAIWLDGQPWSILVRGPVEGVRTASDHGYDWRKDVRSLRRSSSGAAADVPFASGIVGYLGYDARPLPSDLVDVVAAKRQSTHEPSLYLNRYEGALCFHHPTQTWVGTGDQAQKVDRVLRSAVPLVKVGQATGTLQDPEEPGDYPALVATIQALLHAGDCYQVNLSRPVRVDQVGNRFDAYRRLRQFRADFGGYVVVDEQTAVLCNSPELLLASEGGSVLTEPIKGTRPRGQSASEDKALATALMESNKDRAELLMIVDMLRNDLATVCRTVKTGERQLMTLPTVFHTKRPIWGELRSDPVDALWALLPPGSVTGAPKRRSVARIAQLERCHRGVYCGSLGFLDDTGRAAWNVAIRTAVVHQDTARFHVGGGVVLASDGLDEWRETQHKAKALIAALVNAPRQGGTS